MWMCGGANDLYAVHVPHTENVANVFDEFNRHFMMHDRLTSSRLYGVEERYITDFHQLLQHLLSVFYGRLSLPRIPKEVYSRYFHPSIPGTLLLASSSCRLASCGICVSHPIGVCYN